MSDHSHDWAPGSHCRLCGVPSPAPRFWHRWVLEDWYDGVEVLTRQYYTFRWSARAVAGLTPRRIRCRITITRLGK